MLSSARSVVDAIGVQARNVESEAGDQRVHLLNDVERGQHGGLRAGRHQQGHRGRPASAAPTSASLLDKRDQLTQRLAELTGAKATVRSDGGVDVARQRRTPRHRQPGRQPHRRLRGHPDGDSDGTAITFAVVDASGATTVPSGMSGEVGGLTDLLTTTLPAYLTGLDAVAKDLADSVNTQHQAGYDAAGTAGTAMFTYDPDRRRSAPCPSRSPTPTWWPPRRCRVGDSTSATPTRSPPVPVSRVTTSAWSPVSAPRSLESRRRAANQQVLTSQVDGSREQLSGVDLDEEMVNMIAAQRAYEAASRVMTTVDSVLDTLINRTGVR